MLSFILVTLVLVLFGGPFTWLLWQSAGARGTELAFEDRIDAIGLGYAISFVTLFASAQLRLWLFAPIWLAAALAAVVVAVRRRNVAMAVRGSFDFESRVLLGSSALYLVLRCLPFLRRRLPLGWDAYFHMTIAESILERGRAVRDWLPFEDMPLNYPIGAHLLMAFTQRLTDVRPHQFFELMVVLFTWLSGLQLFSLIARATRDRRLGCYAALAYLFLGNLGSLHYAIWSGLPNLIGMYLFLGLLSALTIEESSRLRGTAVFTTYFLGACFVHHHVMVTAGLCLGWTGIASVLAGDRALAKRIARGLLASALIGSPYFVMYLLRSVGLRNTEIAGYMENLADPWTLAQDLGLGFSIAVAAGVYLYFKQAERVSNLVLQPLLAMLVLYILVEFVVRTGSQVLFDHELAPFTPSRFITDAVALLSVFAGMFFRSMQGEREARRGPIVALILIGFIFFNRATYRDTFNHEVSRARRTTYEWIRNNAQPDAVLIDEDLHATYLTRRMSSSFPLPTSEYSALARNRRLLEDIAAGRERPERTGRQVLAVVDRGRKAPKGRVLWQHRSGLRVIETFAPPR